jgi:hypothetical protein
MPEAIAIRKAEEKKILLAREKALQYCRSCTYRFQFRGKVYGKEMRNPFVKSLESKDVDCACCRRGFGLHVVYDLVLDIYGNKISPCEFWKIWDRPDADYSWEGSSQYYCPEMMKMCQCYCPEMMKIYNANL